MILLTHPHLRKCVPEMRVAKNKSITIVKLFRIGNDNKVKRY